VETTLPTNDLRALPKVELHRHLEGAIRLQTIIDVYGEAGMELPAQTVAELAPQAQLTTPLADLARALEAFGLAQGTFTGYEATRRVACEAVEDLDADGVRLAELRFSPEFLCERARLDWDRAFDALVEGVAEAGRDVAVGLIAIFSRNYGPASLQRTVEFALRHRDRLVGFDVAGPEVGYPAGQYAAALEPLREAGVALTVHYGESGPPEYVREAVETLRPDRLGHGLSTALDGAVADLVAERGVPLEMCPTSNWLTSGVPTLAEHPCRRLLREGLLVTLNTDDPGLFGIDLTHEYGVARDAIGFEPRDFAAATANALEASFLPPDVKDDIRRRHFGWLDAAPAG
jgi:adenosine deaminase